MTLGQNHNPDVLGCYTKYMASWPLSHPTVWARQCCSISGQRVGLRVTMITKWPTSHCFLDEMAGTWFVTKVVERLQVDKIGI